jgi:multiple sugar transport system substrate-binding protein
MSRKLSLSRRNLLKIAGASAAYGVLGAPRILPAAAQGGTQIDAIGPYLANTDVTGNVELMDLWGEDGVANQLEVFYSHYGGMSVDHNPIPAGEMRNFLLTQMAGGIPPDLAYLVSSGVPEFAQIGALLPLSDLAERDQLGLDMYYPAEIGTHSFNGELYSLPMLTSAGHHMLYINNAVFEEVGLDPASPPMTWRELEEMAEVVKEKRPGSILYDHTRTFNKPMFMVWLYANNGSYLSDDMTTVTFNSQEGLETLQWMLDFAKLQAGSYEAMADTGPMMGEAPVDSFFTGRTAMRTGGSWGYFYLKRDNPDVDMTVARLPYNGDNPDAQQQTPADGGWGLIIPKAARNPEAAWEFAKFFSAGEGNHSFILERNRPSPVKAYTEDPALKEANPFMDAIIKDMAASVAVPVTPVHQQLKDTMRDMTEAVLFEEQSPEEALEQYAGVAQQQLDQYWEIYG